MSRTGDDPTPHRPVDVRWIGGDPIIAPTFLDVLKLFPRRPRDEAT